MFPVFLAPPAGRTMDRTWPRHGTPPTQGFAVGAKQGRLLRLGGWGGFGVEDGVAGLGIG